MDDCQTVNETFLSGIEPDKSIAESPISFYIKIDHEQKDALRECLAKVKPMGNMNDMMNAALGLWLTNLYKDHYTTE